MLYEYCVIGGGIVGLATAMELLDKRPGASLLLLEKEGAVGQHQTGHNSGVIHAGIYYDPQSLKARLCRIGLKATAEFCAEHGVPHKTVGKLIVATNAVEVKRLDGLYDRATANGLTLTRMSGAELSEREPNINGIDALLSPETGMGDFIVMCEKMAEIIAMGGAEVKLNTEVDRIAERGDAVEIGASGTTYTARTLIVCAGLQADRMVRLSGMEADFRIVPFRGEYFRLPPEKNGIVTHHIYPAPNPLMPFLGVHLTRMIDGSVTVGPNAVVGFSREGYNKLSIDLGDIFDYSSYFGFWKLIGGNLQHAFKELYGSFWKPGYLEECRKYCPSLMLSDFLPHRAGIRAQAVTADGKTVDDFLFKQSDRIVHVCNAPSPAATSAIPIGRMIVERILVA